MVYTQNEVLPEAEVEAVGVKLDDAEAEALLETLFYTLLGA